MHKLHFITAHLDFKIAVFCCVKPLFYALLWGYIPMQMLVKLHYITLKQNGEDNYWNKEILLVAYQVILKKRFESIAA